MKKLLIIILVLAIGAYVCIKTGVFTSNSKEVTEYVNQVDKFRTDVDKVIKEGSYGNTK